MVRSCAICKVECGCIPDVSLHSVPKNEELRVKWIAAVGKDLKNSSAICSRHFEESGFIYKVHGDGVKRFLKIGTVPSLLLNQHYRDYQEIEKLKCEENTESQDLVEWDENTFSPVNDTQDSDNEANNRNNNIYVLSESSNETETIMYFSPINEQGTHIDEKETSLYSEENKKIAKFCSLDESNDETSRSNNFSPVNEVEEEDEILDDDIDENEIKIIRKTKEPLTGAKRYIVPRFVGDLRRDDFTSDASFKIVQNHIKETRLKCKTMSRKIERLTERVKHYTEIMNRLKGNQLHSPEAINILKNVN